MTGASRLRLLMTADAVGGIWQYAVDLARGLSARGIETLLACMGPSPTKAQVAATVGIEGLTFIDTGLPLDWLADDADAVLTAGEAVAALAKREGVDVVQLNTPALAAKARFGVPVIAVMHSCVATWWRAVRSTPLPSDFAWRTALVRAGLQAADRVIAPTAAFAEAVARTYALPQRPAVVHNGRSLLDCPQGPLHDFAFTAGRLWDEGKNLATLDRAAARLGVPVRAAGPITGPNRSTIDLAHIHHLEQLDEKAMGRWLAARPVFVSTARYEPFGLAVLEAAAAGCPLVLSDIATLRELWDGAAWFVPPDDDAGFADAIETILGDSVERLRRGQIARERAARYTPAVMADGMAKIYGALRPSLRPRSNANMAAA